MCAGFWLEAVSDHVLRTLLSREQHLYIMYTFLAFPSWLVSEAESYTLQGPHPKSRCGPE